MNYSTFENEINPLAAPLLLGRGGLPLGHGNPLSEQPPRGQQGTIFVDIAKKKRMLLFKTELK